MLTVQQVAKRYGLSSKTIYREIETQRLEVLRLGKQNSKRPVFRITETALSAWEIQQTQKAKV